MGLGEETSGCSGQTPSQIHWTSGRKCFARTQDICRKWVGGTSLGVQDQDLEAVGIPGGHSAPFLGVSCPLWPFTSFCLSEAMAENGGPMYVLLVQ